MIQNASKNKLIFHIGNVVNSNVTFAHHKLGKVILSFRETLKFAEISGLRDTFLFSSEELIYIHVHVQSAAHTCISMMPQIMLPKSSSQENEKYP